MARPRAAGWPARQGPPETSRTGRLLQQVDGRLQEFDPQPTIVDEPPDIVLRGPDENRDVIIAEVNGIHFAAEQRDVAPVATDYLLQTARSLRHLNPPPSG
jgi:hypothetical protein